MFRVLWQSQICEDSQLYNEMETLLSVDQTLLIIVSLINIGFT